MVHEGRSSSLEICKKLLIKIDRLTLLLDVFVLDTHTEFRKIRPLHHSYLANGDVGG